MELEELKQAWNQYDKKLEENLKFNEMLLKKMNLEKSKKELNVPYIYEIVGVIIISVLIIYMFSIALQLKDEMKYFLPSIISIAIGIYALLMTIKKIRLFSALNFFDDSVIQLQKKLLKIKTEIIKARKYEYSFIPFLIITLLPPLFKVIHNIDIYSDIKLFILRIVIATVIGAPLAIWINRNLYDKKLNAAETYLREIEEFEKE